MPNYKKLPAQSKYFSGPLYQRMLDDLHLAGMADRTIYGYIRAVRQLAEFSQLAPDQLAAEHVRRWLLRLKIDQQRAYRTLRVAFSEKQRSRRTYAPPPPIAQQTIKLPTV